LACLTITGIIAAGTWRAPAPKTPAGDHPGKEAVLPDTQPSADDDHSDAADVWRLKQQELQSADSDMNPAEPFEGPYEPPVVTSEDNDITLRSDQ
jgi:hypothetical protein